MLRVCPAMATVSAISWSVAPNLRAVYLSIQTQYSHRIYGRTADEIRAFVFGSSPMSSEIFSNYACDKSPTTAWSASWLMKIGMPLNMAVISAFTASRVSCARVMQTLTRIALMVAIAHFI